MRLLAALAAASVVAGPASAQQSFPAKPIRFIVAFAPGGIADTIGRTIGQKLADKVGQNDFDHEDERILMILGAQVGRIYENGSLYHQLQRRSDQLQNEVLERERTAERPDGQRQLVVFDHS